MPEGFLGCKGGQNGSAEPAADAERQRIDHAGAGQKDDDERGNEEFGSHVWFHAA